MAWYKGIVEQFRDFVQRHNPEGNDHFVYGGHVWDQQKKEYHGTTLGKAATRYVLKLLGYDDLSFPALNKNRKKALDILHPVK